MIACLQNKFKAIEKRYPTQNKLLRFIISGGMATGTYLLLTFMLIEWLHVWYILAATMAFFVAFLISFFLQKFWTFRDRSKEKIHQQAGIFLLTIIGGVGLNALLLYLFVEYVQLHYLVAQIINGVFIACVNYIIYQKIFFIGQPDHDKNFSH